LDELSNSNDFVTAANGIAVVPFKFYTNASNKNPITRAHTSYAWVIVHAEGYGGTVVPVRHESTPTKQLREQGLMVPVGLISSK
jgi:hypothetical protein